MDFPCISSSFKKRKDYNNLDSVKVQNNLGAQKKKQDLMHLHAKLTILECQQLSIAKQSLH